MKTMRQLKDQNHLFAAQLQSSSNRPVCTRPSSAGLLLFVPPCQRIDHKACYLCHASWPVEIENNQHAIPLCSAPCQENFYPEKVFSLNLLRILSIIPVQLTTNSSI